MFLDLSVGPLTEPLTGRTWGPGEILERARRRMALYDALGSLLTIADLRQVERTALGTTHDRDGQARASRSSSR